jgi:hypothetical protein
MRKYDQLVAQMKAAGFTVGAPKEVVAKKTGDKLSVLNFKLESEGVSGSIWLKLETKAEPEVKAPAAATVPGIDPNMMAAFAAFMAAQQAAPAPAAKPARNNKKAA